MVCACLPSLRGLVPRCYGRRNRSNPSSSNKLYDNSSSRDKSNKRASEYYQMDREMQATREQSNDNLVSCNRDNSSTDIEEGIRVRTEVTVSRQDVPSRQSVATIRHEV